MHVAAGLLKLFRGESSVLDDDLGDHGVLAVKGHDLSVGQAKIARSRATDVLRMKHPKPGCYDE